jgi:Spy/CpxP family protein refolding chaperone
MKTLPLIASFVAAAALAIPATAQPAGKATGPRPAQHQARKGQQGERFMQAMRRIGVDEARIQQVVAIHKKYASQHQKVRDNTQQHREALRALVEKNSQNEAAYERELAALETAKKEQIRLRDAERAEVRKVLKPSEQAKLLTSKHPGHPRTEHRGGPSPQNGMRTTGPREGNPRGRGPSAGSGGNRDANRDGPRAPKRG